MFSCIEKRYSGSFPVGILIHIYAFAGQKDAFREWKQSAETLAKKLQLTVEEKLDGFVNNLTALQGILFYSFH